LAFGVSGCISILIGAGIIISSLYKILRPGSYFVGTPTRFIRYDGKKIRSIDWVQFSGDIETSGNDTDGNIVLRLRTGNIVNDGTYYTQEYMPYAPCMNDIPGV
jgi:hypothetical protein